MCGRYGEDSRKSRLEKLLDRPLIGEEDFVPRYNVAPGTPCRVVRLSPEGDEARLERLLWGLVPYWCKDLKSAVKPINAKAETVDERPMFKQLLRERRCLVPADWFYEWRRSGVGKTARKQPFVIRMVSLEPFFFAGLWDRWRSPEGESLYTFTLLTCEPNELMATIHDRMPVIVRPEHYDAWLDPAYKDAAKLKQTVLTPFSAEEMIAYPVGPLGNDARNEGAELIEPVAEPELPLDD